MTVQRYEPYRCCVYQELEKDDCGDYVAYSDYASLNEKLRAAWQEHFLLSRENATLLKERIRLTREVAEARAAMLVEPRVWQD